MYHSIIYKIVLKLDFKLMPNTFGHMKLDHDILMLLKEFNFFEYQYNIYIKRKHVFYENLIITLVIHI